MEISHKDKHGYVVTVITIYIETNFPYITQCNVIEYLREHEAREAIGYFPKAK